MKKNSLTLLLSFIGLYMVSCGEAKFGAEDPPREFSFASSSTVDDSYNFYSKYYFSNTLDLEADLNPALIPTGATAQNATDLEEEPLFFQRTVVAIKIIGPGEFKYFESPLIKNREDEFVPVILNTPATALYHLIKNLLPQDTYLNIVLNREDWDAMLTIVEKECFGCLDLSLTENFEKILNSNETFDELSEYLKSSLNEPSLVLEKKPLEEWALIFASLNPEVTFSIAEVDEGSEVEFTAFGFHPSQSNQLIQPEVWTHNFEGTAETTNNSTLLFDFYFNFDIAQTYNVSFDFYEDLDMPNDSLSFNLIVKNVNRAPIISPSAQSSQTFIKVQRFAETVGLLGDFEELDDNDQITSCQFTGSVNPELIFDENACTFSITENLQPGLYNFEVRALDQYGDESDPKTITLEIVENNFPTFDFAYLSTSPTDVIPATRYNNNDRIDLNEGETYYLHIVSTDTDSDLTVLAFSNFNNTVFAPQRQIGWERSGSRIRGVTSPLSGSNFDSVNNGTPFQSGNRTITVIEIKPSFYHVIQNEDGSSTQDDMNFYPVRSKLASDTSKVLIIPATFRDSFRLQVRVNNVDDPPELNRSRISIPNATEGSLFSFTIPEDASFDPSPSPTPVVYQGFYSANQGCDGWLGYSGSTRTFSGTPPLDSQTNCTIRIRTYDDSGSLFPTYTHIDYQGQSGLRSERDESFTFSIANNNGAPQVNNSNPYIVPLNPINEDQTFEFPFSLYSSDPGFNGGVSFFHDPDRSTTLNDPRESFSISCEIRAEGEVNYTTCSDRGIQTNLSTVDGATSWIRPDFSTLGPEDDQNFQMRIGFKDNDSPSYIYKMVHFTVLNTPAPIQITVDDSSISLREGDEESTIIRVQRFSDYPIDTYDFTMTLNDSNSNPTTSFDDDRENKIIYFVDVDSSTSIQEIFFKPGYDDGDGLDGTPIRTYGYSLRAEQINCTSNCIENQSSNVYNYTVSHVNLPPTTVQVGVSDTSTDNSTLNYTVNYAELQDFSPIDLRLKTIDPDVQDRDSEDDFTYSSLNLSGNAVRLLTNIKSIRIRPDLCAVGTSSLTKNFKVRTQDPGIPPGSVERNVRVTITGVNQPSSTCN